MTLPASDIQRPDPGALVELFVLDPTSLGGTLVRWHAGVNALGADVVWQGNTYPRMPIEAEGFELTAKGPLPRPKLRAANVTGLLGALAKQYQDLVGAKVTRRRTFVKYLDAVNFAGGINPTADPNIAFADDVYYVFRKSGENKVFLEFELAAAWDAHGKNLPGRQVIANTCMWKYRGAECGYTGGPVADANDTATTNSTLDQCGKRIKSCQRRFGALAELPFGAFPGAGLFR